MKNFLFKSLSIFTVLSMIFTSNIALATPAGSMTICHIPPGNLQNPQTIIINGNAWQAHQAHGDTQGPCQNACAPQTFLSDDADGTLQVDEHNAVAVTTPVNGGWTASIPGAEWVWSEANVTDATIDITKTFTKTFTITGTPVGGTLDIAADNSYEVSVNGNTDVFVDALENNYASGPNSRPGNGQDSYVIPAGYLVTGLNTITFEVKNMGILLSTPLENPAGLMYKLTVNCTQTPQQVCQEGNHVTNGGFETPIVTHGAMWNIYPDGTAGLGWDVAWHNAPGAPEIANLELHRGVAGWLSQEGSQHAELDTDWGGPDSAGTGEPASVMISQTITTIPGESYDLSYYYSPRPDMDTVAGENVLEVRVNNVLVDTKTPDAFDDANTTWKPGGVSFTGTGSDTISFRDDGLPANSVGTFLDNVRVDCVEDQEDPGCDNNEIWARVVVTAVANTGVGNASNTIYLGSNANTVASGEWFPLSVVDAGGIEAYADVPGIAVRRKPGQRIALELYGRSAGPQSTVGSEHVDGYIEFWNGMPTNQVPAANGSSAKLEFTNGSVPADAISITGDKSNFSLSVNTGSDRYDTLYQFSPEEDCLQ